MNQLRKAEAMKPAATKVGEATNWICLKACMSSSKRQGEESTMLPDRILKLEGVDGVEELKKQTFSVKDQIRPTGKISGIAIRADG